MFLTGYFLCFVAILVAFLFAKHKKHPKMPPGLTGWPIIGSFPSISVPFFDQVETNRRKFGDVFLWKIGSRDIVFVCDPKIIKSTLANPHFLNRPKEHFTFDVGTNFKKIGITNANGLEWQSHRRFALQHLRDAGFGKSVVENIVQFEAEMLVEDIRENFLNHPVDIPFSVNVATLNVILKLTTDMRFSRNDEATKGVMKAISAIVKQSQGLLNIFDLFPRLVDVTPISVMNMIGLKDTLQNAKDITDFLKDLLEKKKMTLDREHPNGFIESYLSKTTEEESKEVFKEEALVATLADLLIAGSDTTAIQTEWLLQHVAVRPQLQAKIQKEIDDAVPAGRYPTLKDKQMMPYTEATINEGLRSLSLATFGLFRTASEDTEIGEFFIPKGTIILPYLYGCHVDPKRWENPNQFYPEHFLDNEGKFVMKNEAFLPFSFGRRVCLGEALARTEMFLYFTSILQNFDLSIPEGGRNIVEISPEVTTFRFASDLKVIFTERK